MTTEVGGPIYIGDAPSSESFPDYDSTIDKNNIITNAVIAGPITINATVTVEGNMVVL